MLAPVLVFAALAVDFWWAVNQTGLGRKLYAVGANERTAAFLLISTARVRSAAFVSSGLCAGLADFLFLSRTGYVSCASGGDLSMATIAELVIGGMSLSGGIGGTKHAISGVLLLTSLSNFVNIMLISPYVQNAVNGIVILIAVSIHSHLNAVRT